MEKISVFLDENNEIGSFLDSKKICLFSKAETWNKEKEIIINPSELSDMNSMRKYFSELILELEDCKIVFVNKAIGIPYCIFFQNDFSVWEFQRDPYKYFDYVLGKENEHIEKIIKDKEEERKLVKVIKPGYFLIDLEEVQRKKPDLTTKMVIKPFLEKKEFATLEVHCCHVPPWLEVEKEVGIISMEVKKYNSEKVILYISRKLGDL